MTATARAIGFLILVNAALVAWVLSGYTVKPAAVLVVLAAACATFAFLHPVVGCAVPVVLAATWIVPAAAQATQYDGPEGGLSLFVVVLFGAVSLAAALLGAAVGVARRVARAEPDGATSQWGLHAMQTEDAERT